MDPLQTTACGKPESKESIACTLDLNSQIVRWCVTLRDNSCLYTKKMMSKIFRVSEMKLARSRMYLVYKGKSWILQWGKTFFKKIYFLGRKMYQYCSRVYQKMQNSHIWGCMFSKKVAILHLLVSSQPLE